MSRGGVLSGDWGAAAEIETIGPGGIGIGGDGAADEYEIFVDIFGVGETALSGLNPSGLNLSSSSVRMDRAWEKGEKEADETDMVTVHCDKLWLVKNILRWLYW